MHHSHRFRLETYNKLIKMFVSWAAVWLCTSGAEPAPGFSVDRQWDKHEEDSYLEV